MPVHELPIHVKTRRLALKRQTPRQVGLVAIARRDVVQDSTHPVAISRAIEIRGDAGRAHLWRSGGRRREPRAGLVHELPRISRAVARGRHPPLAGCFVPRDHAVVDAGPEIARGRRRGRRPQRLQGEHRVVGQVANGAATERRRPVRVTVVGSNQGLKPGKAVAAVRIPHETLRRVGRQIGPMPVGARAAVEHRQVRQVGEVRRAFPQRRDGADGRHPPRGGFRRPSAACRS